ncbi:MAG: trigger factor [Anaerofustis sp.]|jgi:trigger factor
MSNTIVKNEKNVAVVKLEISKEDFEKGIDAAYQKSKNRFVVDGFRKGKAPRSFVERKYGKGIFYEDAIDEAFPAAYTSCLEENGFKAVAAPKLVSLDKVGEDGAELTIEISLEPVFEIAEYKNIKTGPIEYAFKEEDAEEELKKMQDKNSRLVTVEDASKEGDTVTIDFEGFVDDVAFEGGKGEDYPLELGSGTFIPGFEEQLVGKNPGEDTDVKVTFPEEYHAPNLAGKESVFKVTVKEVKRKEMPEADDEFAKDLGFDDLAALKEDIKTKLIETKGKELKAKAEQTAIDTIVEKTEIEIPAQMLAERTQSIQENYETRLKSSGIDPEMYYRYMMETNGVDNPDYFDEMFQTEAIKDIKTELIIKKIIEKEAIEATEEELEAEYAKFAETAKQTVEEFKQSLNEYTINYIKGIVAQNKMFDFLLENADTDE